MTFANSNVAIDGKVGEALDKPARLRPFDFDPIHFGAPSATAAEVNVAELLGVPRGASVLRIRQVIYSSKGKATIYGVGFYLSERHTLFIRRFR